MTRVPTVKVGVVTTTLRAKLKLPKWIEGDCATVAGVTAYGTIYGYDWKQLEAKKFQRDMDRVEKAGFTAVLINSDDDSYAVAVKGPLSKLSDAQARALFDTSDFQRYDRMDL